MRVNGIDVLIADEVQGYAAGSLVDYVNLPYSNGFTIEAVGYGGCG